MFYRPRGRKRNGGKFNSGVIVIVKVEGQCKWDGCEREATVLACGKKGYDDYPGHPEPAPYCETHGRVVADENSPEYKTECPNCGCRFGVN